MSRTRTFESGKISVTFCTEEEAKEFDNYLESTFALTIDGQEVDRWKVKDRFNPYEFFHISADN